ncbi:MAG: hypothetical protein CMJ83_22755 [Planctomycetes bacterium]|nr:hypothetical protein [Planctomycetota bacterium]
MDSRIMINGLTRPEDAALSLEFGATYLGCELVPESPRCVSASVAKDIFAPAVGQRAITKVLSFRGSTVEEVTEAAKEAGTRHVMVCDFLESDAELLEKGGHTVYRVYEVPTGSNMLPPMLPEPQRRRPAVLTTTSSVNDLTFPWEILGNQAPEATFIGGSVNPENVCALLTHHPYGMIVNAGVEHELGIKDADRLALFFDTLVNGF